MASLDLALGNCSDSSGWRCFEADGNSVVLVCSKLRTQSFECHRRGVLQPELYVGRIVRFRDHRQKAGSGDDARPILLDNLAQALGIDDDREKLVCRSR